MGYAEKRGSGANTYYRGRFKIAPGKYGTVMDEHGDTKRFRTKRDAEKAANDEEAKVRSKKWRDLAAGQITFGEWANRWYAGLDLAASTMANYKRRVEQHLLPTFEAAVLADILPSDVDAWNAPSARPATKRARSGPGGLCCTRSLLTRSTPRVSSTSTP